MRAIQPYDILRAYCKTTVIQGLGLAQEWADGLVKQSHGSRTDPNTLGI